jgi:hypothetical protein
MTEEIREFMMSVVRAAATECGVSVARVMSKSRKKELIMARFLSYKIISERTSHIMRDGQNKLITTGVLADFMGGFNHTAVVHGIQTANIAIGEDPKIKPNDAWRKAYDNILERLSPSMEMEVIAAGSFFPYTQEGYIKARNFLWDLGEYGLREGRREVVVRNANRILNKYRTC